LQGPQPTPRPQRLIVEPHAVVAVRTPRSRGELQGRGGWALPQMVARGGGMDAEVPGERAVHLTQKVGSLKPPMAEQFGIEWRHDHGSTIRLRNAIEEVHEVLGVIGHAPTRRGRIVGLLVAEIDTVPRDAPELQSAGPSDLVELQIRPVARIPAVPAPDL